MRKAGLVGLAVSLALGSTACGGGAPSEPARSPGNPRHPVSDGALLGPARDAAANDRSTEPEPTLSDAGERAPAHWAEVTLPADSGVTGLQIVSASAAATD